MNENYRGNGHTECQCNECFETGQLRTDLWQEIYSLRKHLAEKNEKLRKATMKIREIRGIVPEIITDDMVYIDTKYTIYGIPTGAIRTDGWNEDLWTIPSDGVIEGEWFGYPLFELAKAPALTDRRAIILQGEWDCHYLVTPIKGTNEWKIQKFDIDN